MLSYMILWKARRAFAEFLERDKENYCEAGSLKGIWSKLNKITIGTIKVGNKTFQQLSPLNELQIKLLRAVNANLNKEAKQRLQLVG